MTIADLDPGSTVWVAHTGYGEMCHLRGGAGCGAAPEYRLSAAAAAVRDGQLCPNCAAALEQQCANNAARCAARKGRS